MKKTCIEQDCYYVIILENLLNVNLLPCLVTIGTQNKSIKRKIIEQILLKILLNLAKSIKSYMDTLLTHKKYPKPI